MQVYIDTKDLNKIFNQLLKSLKSQKLQNLLGLAVTRKVKDRTRKGTDVDGSPFKPYSKGYKKKRKQAGLSTSTVNLAFSKYDSMQKSIDHIVSRDFSKVVVYIKNNNKKRQIARYHHYKGAGKSKVVRKWFGLSKQDKIDIKEIARKTIYDIVSNLN